jgi:hypothetical protein
MWLVGADPLTEFLRSAAQRGFSWGEHDCLLWLADWIEDRRGVDAAGLLRGSYRTALEAQRLVKREGGLVALIDQRMAPLGIARTDQPQRGDIAIVDGPENRMGALILDGASARLFEGGIVVTPLPITPVVAAWRVLP